MACNGRGVSVLQGEPYFENALDCPKVWDTNTLIALRAMDYKKVEMSVNAECG